MKSIAILGAKESGLGAALLAKKQGWETFVSDGGIIPEKFKSELIANEISFEENQHTESKIISADIIVKSPGIPDKSEIMKALHKAGKEIISEIEFGSRFTDAKIIAITGANGKTTTTLLTHHVLKNGGLNVGMAGNVGNSFARSVAEDHFDYYVLEVSSFQLDDITSFRPNISVLLNITPDHLDRYEYSMEKYADSKFRITMNQESGDAFIYCMDDEVTVQYLDSKNIKAKKYGFSLEKKPGAIAWLDNKTINVEMELDNTSYDYGQMTLSGKHNAYNTMASAIVARLLEIRKDSVRQSFSDFKNLEHRLEKVSVVRGVEFINDSKATNVNSAWYALESADKPVIWIAGGVDKGNDYSILLPIVEKKVKTIIGLGKDLRKIHEAFGKKVPMIVNTQSMEEAVKMAYHVANKGDVVLLSPACASFDLFENYEDRGRQFKQCVRKL